MALLPWGSMCMLWIAPPERLPNDFITEALVCQQFFNKKGRFSRSFQCEWRGSNPHAQRAQDFKSRLSAYSNTLATIPIITAVQPEVKQIFQNRVLTGRADCGIIISGFKRACARDSRCAKACKRTLSRQPRRNGKYFVCSPLRWRKGFLLFRAIEEV